ncbi:hypothetical protein HY29_18270 [Hyphomonas beringensis]|uniref:Insecticide toxin TcdB middle/N-terminal domain-containing protein n=1 Tax=Hyphomonas beringensis TaxID=1280946 RepID=A0A062U1J3_9PROT|nr:RHS repeat protein [Hyphomonas beringensis]KCZ52147.1 hypothetical protein HY29_18270 [Hyphomonas beringensis]
MIETVQRGNDTFSTSNAYNADASLSSYDYESPYEVILSSNLQPEQRVFEYDYQHDPVKWIIGLQKTVTQNSKLLETFIYNSNGQIETHKKFGADFEAYTYHTHGNQVGALATITNALGNITSFDSYKRGKPQLVINPDTTTRSSVVDDNGWTSSETNERRYTTSYQYNLVGWLIKIVPPQGNGAVADVDATYSIVTDGIVQTITQGSLEITNHYDGLFRPFLTKIEDTSRPGTVSYQSKEYDALNRVVFVSFPSATSVATAGLETDYDALGRRTEVHQTVSPFASVTRDYLNGNKVRITDPRGNQTTVTYLSYGLPDEELPKLIDYQAGADAILTYDIWGNKLTETQGAANSSYTYDSSLRLFSVTDPDTYTSYTYYDAVDRPIVQIDGAGRKTRTVYDSMGRPEKLIKAWAGNNGGTGSTLDCAAMRASYDPSSYLQQCYKFISYTPTGKIDAITDAGGNVTTHAYDALDRLTHTHFPSPTQTGKTSTTDYERVVYDVFSRPDTKRTRSGDVIDYTYDALGRLVGRYVPGAPTHTANGGTVTHSYTYNAAGRKLTAVHDGVTLSYGYDAIGRVEWQKHNGTRQVSYSYDAANNLRYLTYPDNWSIEYQYDALNRVTDAIENNGIPRTFAHIDYDNLSRRKSITYANGTSSWFDYSDRGDLTCHDWNLTGTSPTACASSVAELEYGFTYNGVSQVLTQTVSDPSMIWTPDVSTTAYQPNGLDQYTSIGGDAISYDGNGNLIAGLNDLTFTYDAENVLRTVADAVGYNDQMNLYAYVGNDPVNGTDPTGMYCLIKNTFCARKERYEIWSRDPKFKKITVFPAAAASTLDILDTPRTFTGLSKSTVQWLETLSWELEKKNVAIFKSLKAGEAVPSITDAPDGIDRAFVRYEQGQVQQMLDELKDRDAEQYKQVVEELNSLFKNRGWGSNVVQSAERHLGRGIDFSKEGDRRTIGYRSVQIEAAFSCIYGDACIAQSLIP